MIKWYNCFLIIKLNLATLGIGFLNPSSIGPEKTKLVSWIRSWCTLYQLVLIVIAKIEVFQVQYIKQVYQTDVVFSFVVLLAMIYLSS